VRGRLRRGRTAETSNSHPHASIAQSDREAGKGGKGGEGGRAAGRVSQQRSYALHSSARLTFYFQQGWLVPGSAIINQSH
jgi:hypothetical protein